MQSMRFAVREDRVAEQKQEDSQADNFQVVKSGLLGAFTSSRVTQEREQEEGCDLIRQPPAAESTGWAFGDMIGEGLSDTIKDGAQQPGASDDQEQLDLAGDMIRDGS
jgi:hypothetical protein